MCRRLCCATANVAEVIQYPRLAEEESSILRQSFDMPVPYWIGSVGIFYIYIYERARVFWR